MIKAVFMYQIYLSNDGSYSVNHFLVKESENETYCSTGDLITVIGNNVPTFKNVNYVLQGNRVPYKKGKGEMQLKLLSFHEVIPEKGQEVLGYMESGIIKGIGSKNAKIIFQKFGENSLSVIEKTPEKLLDLKGFGLKSVKKISDSYKEHVQSKETLLFLSRFSINTKLGLKIFDKYGKDTEQTIRNNPYSLLEIKGIGFDLADDIARKLGYDMLSETRIEAGILYTLKVIEHEDGNIGTPIERLESKLYQVLKIAINNTNRLKVNEVSNRMIFQKKVIINKGLCFRPEIYQLETECASHMIRIAGHKTEFKGKNLEKIVDDVQRKENIVLDKIQRDAVISAIQENFMIITGGPGSGKTTTIRCVVEVLKAMWPKKTFKLMAPTGRAARRMTESTNMYASTIHSGLRISTDEERDMATNDIEEDFIIVDEVSMIDLRLATLLFRSIETGKKLIFVGDVDQLPSVGPGAVLRDIIISNSIKVVKLERIFRQDKDSSIYINSKRIKEENTELLESTDFSIVEAYSFEEAADFLLDIYQEKVKRWGIDNVALLTPYRRHIAGCEYMNKEIQELINPGHGTKELKYRNQTFRVGDRIMNLLNTAKEGVDISNGDIGIIKNIDVAANKITVEFFGDTLVDYEEDELEELDLAYSYTIHKSQGGEYDCVITTICDQHIEKMKTKNLLYTAITRGKKEVVIVGSRDAIKYAIKHKLDNVRHSLLSEKIRQQNKKYNIIN